eukprot:7124197-Heterocapsa_arctica.AAC.1
MLKPSSADGSGNGRSGALYFENGCVRSSCTFEQWNDPKTRAADSFRSARDARSGPEAMALDQETRGPEASPSQEAGQPGSRAAWQPAGGSPL